MSDVLDTSLFFHLPLAEITNNKFYDATQAQRNAQATGVNVDSDDQFGRCLILKGEAGEKVELPDVSPVFTTGKDCTIMLSFRLETASNSVRLFELHNPKQKLVLGVTVARVQDSLRFYLDTYNNQDQTVNTVPYGASIAQDVWCHLAITWVQNTPKLFINGEPHNIVGGPIGSHALNDNPTNRLGSSQQNIAPFVGRLAHCRFYSRALDATEIQNFIARDKSIDYRYRLTHPLDFDLENRDGDPTLYMDDHPDGQTLYLRLRNISAADIQLSQTTNEPVSATNHHIELAFRAGVLKVEALRNTLPEGWSSLFKPSKEAEDRDSLYLLCPQASQTIAAGQTQILTLNNILPDTAFGARTTQVELIYKNLRSISGEPLNGQTTQKLNLVNHLGRRTIPLHIGFSGSNQVMSDGNSNLTLRITNICKNLQADAAIAGRNFMQFGEKTELELFFDEGTQSWDLTSSEQCKAISIEARVVASSGDPKIDLGHIPRSNAIKGTDLSHWIIPLNALKLEEDQSIEISIQGIQATNGIGHSNIYIIYRKVPGYWDGQFVCQIEKTCLIERDKTVLIGESSNKANLQVSGKVSASSFALSMDNNNRGALFLAKDGDFNHALYNNYSGLDGSASTDSAYWNTFNGLTIRTGNGNDKTIGFQLNGGGVTIAKTLSVGEGASVTGNSEINGALKIGAIDNGQPALSIGTSSGSSFSVDANGNVKTNSVTLNNTALFFREQFNYGFALFHNVSDNSEPGWNLEYKKGPASGICFNVGKGFRLNSEAAWQSNGGMESTLSIIPNGKDWVGIGKNEPLGRLHVKDHQIVIEGDSSNNLHSPRLYLVDTQATKDASTATAWVVDNFKDEFRIFRESNIGQPSAFCPVKISKKDYSNSDFDIACAKNKAGKIVLNGDVYVRGRLIYYWNTKSDLAETQGGDNTDGWYAIGNGNGYAHSSKLNPQPSDTRLKTDLRPITGALNILTQLQGTRYRWDETGLTHFTRHIDASIYAGPDATEQEHQTLRDEHHTRARSILSGEQIGLIAQEVEAVLPELVSEDGEGYKHVDYQHMVAVLVEAVKEQQAVIQALEARVLVLEGR